MVIALLKGGHVDLMERFRRELPQGSIAISAIVLFELNYGVANSARQAENAERLLVFFQAPIAVLDFDADDAREAGEIRARLRRDGTPIGPYDLLIAAQARRRSAVLVTANEGDFLRVPGLVTENWMTASGF